LNLRLQKATTKDKKMADRTNVQLTPGAACSTKRSTIRAVSVAIPTDGYMKLRGYGINSADG
jgi:hypothetical protein